MLAFLLGIINALSIVHREYVVSYHLVEGNQKLKFWLPSGNYEFGISNDALNSKTDDSEKPYQSKLHIEVRGNEDLDMAWLEYGMTVDNRELICPSYYEDLPLNYYWMDE